MNKKLILKICGYLLIAGLFVYLIIQTDFNEIIDNVKNVSLSIILLLVGLQLLTQLLLGLQWHRITKNVIKESKFSKILYILTTGSVVEALTPGAKIGGEVTRLYYLKSEMKASTNDATNIIIIQKSISMSVLFTICIVSFIYLCRMLSVGLSTMSQVLIIILALFLIIILMLFLFFSKKLSKKLEKSQKKFIIKINKFVSSYANATTLIKKSEWCIQFFISFLVWILFPIKMAILCYSVGIEVNFVILIAITMTAYMIATLPITPGGLGTFEVTMASLFALVSVNAAIATTVTIVFRVITFWLVMIISALYAFIYRRIYKTKEVEENEQREIDKIDS